MLQKTFFSVALLATCVFQLSAQIDNVQHLKEVEIFSDRKSYYSDGLKQIVLDTTLLRQNPQISLTDYLQMSTAIFVKSTGSEAAQSSLQVRGATSAQSTVSWNGFSINSTTSGDFNLSDVLMTGIDQVQFTYGGAGSIFGSAAIGGVLELQNKPNWQNRESVETGVEWGSFATQKYRANVKIGNEKTQFHTAVQYNETDGDFTFKNLEGAEQKQEHNSSHFLSLAQYAYVKSSENSQLDFGLWGQKKEMELPLSLSPYATIGLQEDENIRSFVKYKQHFSHSALQLGGAYLYSKLFYESTYSTSVIRTRRILLNADYRHYWGENWSADLAANYENSQANVTSYEEGESREDRFLGMLAVKYHDEKLSLNASSSYQYVTDNSSKPQFSLGGRYFLTNSMKLRANIATKYRVPTLNDKYWLPYGNLNLKAEEGISGDLGFNFTKNIAENKKLEMDVATFISHVNDLIVWRTVEGVFGVINQEESKNKGVETAVSYLVTGKQGSQLRLAAQHSYTHSKNEDNQTSLYVPRHQLNLTANTTFRTFFLQINGNYTDEVAYAEDKNLDDYWLLNGQIGKDFSLKSSKIRTTFRAKNLLDKDYIVSNDYPMPGRSYHLNLSLIY